MHADRAIHAVVHDHEDYGRAVLHGSRELLTVHQKIAVSGETNDGALGMSQLRSDRSGHAVPHRSIGRSELGSKASILMKTLQPPGKIAGPIGKDGVMRQALA